VTARGPVAIVGAAERPSAYASINRIWRDGLARAGVDVRLVPSVAELGEDRYDQVIHHDYREHFAGLARPRTRRLIAVRTWDFGPFPPRWAQVVHDVCDELWVHSRWTAAQAAAGGIDAAKVRVVPHGVDPAVMTPDGPPFLTGERATDLDGRFKFLFVGAAVPRKGVDVLLAAYGRAFDASDRVALVIKDHSGDVFYQGSTLRERIASFRETAGAPHLVSIDAYLDARDLAALYRACDAAVFPYRAEGFAMPVLESMACGTPPIVPRFGPCLDFCDDESAFFVPARRVRLPVVRNVQFNTLGFREDVEEVDFCEVDPDVLAREMRRVAELDRDRLERKAGAAAAGARRFSWDAAVARIAVLLRG
jgi:glycosyltransferase involved in cell wall biosynthesis